MADMRNFALGQFVVDVAGKQVGQVYKFDPPKLTLDLAEAKAGTVNETMKIVSNIQYGEGSIDMGISMGKQMADWIQSAFKMNPLYQDGSCIVANEKFQAQRTIQWLQGIVTEVGLPKLDATSKDACKLTVKFKPEVVRQMKAGGEVIQSPQGAKVKPWVASNFRVEIGDLPCTHVMSVDAMSFKVKTFVDAVGTRKENEVIVTGYERPEVKLTIQRKDEDAWAAAMKKWAIDGLSHQEHELSGRIVYLAHDMSTELGEVKLQRMGFKELAFAAMERTDKGANFTCTLYCEDLSFEPKVFDA